MMWRVPTPTAVASLPQSDNNFGCTGNSFNIKRKTYPSWKHLPLFLFHNSNHQMRSSTTTTSSPSNSVSSALSTSHQAVTVENLNNHHHHHQHRIVRLPESVWRTAALEHQQQIYHLLKPGLTDRHTHPINTGQQRPSPPSHRYDTGDDNHNSNHNKHYNKDVTWTALDPTNPIYNFLIEYYGIKGVKGVKRLARWSPGLFCHYQMDSEDSSNYLGGGVLLEGATERDFSSLLHLRGAIMEDDGILYCPQSYYNEKLIDKETDDVNNERPKSIRTVAPFLWYRAVLEQTVTAEPVLYCYGLHEWAMQYQPHGAPPPPSAKYQAHVPLRVSQDTLNAAVERVGTRCTHVDALRYFSPAAASLNFHGEILHRMDQLRLEQPGCVHAHMDLLKIILKIEPFVSATLRSEVLKMAILARKLDIGASPYDVTSTYQVEMIPIETEEGRLLYRQRQMELMKLVQPVRQELLQAYDDFLSTTFTPELIRAADITPPDPQERCAQTTPGGLPWRKNSIHPSLVE